MKTHLAALMLWLTVVAPAFAGQKAQDARGKVEQRLEEIRDRLALTPEQIEEVRPVLSEEAEKLRALRDKYAAGGQSRRSRRRMARDLRDIRSDADEKLARILSEPQMDELKALREEWRRELRDRAR